jgi:PAS domain-containing protein
MSMEDQARTLQESEGKLTAAARLAHLGYWEIDVVANRVSWSEETARILGLPPTERSRSWDEFLQLVSADDRPIMEECRTRMLRRGPRSRGVPAGVA